MSSRWVVVALVSLVAIAPAGAGPKEKRLPGFTGLVYRDVALKDACAKDTRVIRQAKKGDDAALVKLLTWPRITGLDFPPDDDVRRSDSMRKFQAWLSALVEQGQKVTARQATFARDGKRSAVQRVEATARLVLAQQQIIALIEGIDIPPTIRTSPYATEAIDAFCDTMFDQSEPLAAQVTQTRAYCQKVILEGKVGKGWWTAVCAAPAAAQP